MKKIIKYTLVLLGLFIILPACEKNDPVIWDQLLAGFEDSSALIYFNKESNTDITATFGVMLIGKQQSSALTYTISVDAENTTADASQYNLGTTSVTIPANSSIGEFDFTGIRDEFEPGEVKTVVLNLAGENIGSEFATLTLTLEKELFCPITDASNFIGDYICTEVGYGDYSCAFTQDQTDPLKIWNDNFYDWGADPVYYILSGDLDQTITVPTQTISYAYGAYSDELSGSGYYDGCKGTFHVEYNLGGSTVIHDFNPDTGKSKIVRTSRKGDK